MSNTPLGPVLTGKTNSGEVTPQSLLAVTASMTPAQKAEMRANIGATDTTTAIPDTIKSAILNCFDNVAWTDDSGQECYNELYNALYATVESISVVFDSENAVVCTHDSLDSLRPYLTVTATYYGGTTGTVEGYSLSGSFEAGTQTITVTYGNATDTFSVNVRSATLLFSGVSVGPASNSYVTNTVVSPFDFTMKTKSNTISGANQYAAYASFYGSASLFATYGNVKGHRIRCYHTVVFTDAGGQGTFGNALFFTNDATVANSTRERFSKDVSFPGSVGTMQNGYHDTIIPMDVMDNERWGGTGTVTDASYLTWRVYWQALSGASAHAQLLFYDLGADL